MKPDFVPTGNNQIGMAIQPKLEATGGAGFYLKSALGNVIPRYFALHCGFVSHAHEAWPQGSGTA
jgi:hypothetical protein